MDAAMAASGEKKHRIQTQPSSSSSGAAGGAQPSVVARAQIATEHRQLHLELLKEAGAMALACGGSVQAVVFCPGGSRAEQHTFYGASIAAARAREEAKRKREAQVAAAARGLAEKDMSKMTVEEVKVHRAQLLALRAAVVRKLQEKAASNVGGGDDDAGRRNKIRRIE